MRGKDQRRTERARTLRRVLTPAEFLLWTRLRSRQLAGRKFVRQEPIGRYLDGGQHAGRLADRERDQALWALGYRVMRIWSNEVIDNLDGVLQAIAAELEKPPLTPALSRQAGRGSR